MATSTEESFFIPTKEEERTINLVNTRFDDSDGYFKDLEINSWIPAQNQYLGTTPQKDDDIIKSSLFVPETLYNVETVVASEMRVFQDFLSEFVTVKAKKPEHIPFCEGIKQLLLWQLFESNFRNLVDPYARQRVKKGITCGKVYWRHEIITRTKKSRRMVERLVPHEGLLGDLIPPRIVYEEVVEEEEVQEVLHHHPQFEPLEMENVRLDRDATCIEDSRFFIEIIPNADKEWLLEQEEEGYYENVSKIPKIKEYLESENIGLLDEYTNQSDVYTEKDRNAGICLREYWEPDRHVVLVQEDNIILLDEPNPTPFHEIPYAIDFYIPLEFMMDGVGIPEATRDLQDEINTKRNQCIDNVDFSLNRIWLVNEGAINNPRAQLVSAPDHIIICNDKDGIEALQTPDVTSGVFKEIEDCKKDLQRTSGVTDEFAGQTQVRHRQTGKEIQLKHAQAAGRLGYYTKNMHNGGIRRVLYLYHILNMQNLDRDQIFQRMGKEDDIIEVPLEAFQERYSIYIIIDEEEQDKTEKQNFLTQAMGMPLLQNPALIDQKEFLRQYFEVFGMDAKKIIMPDQPPPQQLPMLGQNPPQQPPQPGASGMPPQMPQMMGGG